MKICIITTLLVFSILLAACQPAASMPAPQQSPTPPPPAKLAPAPSAVPTQTPLQPVYVTAFCTTIGKDLETYVASGTPVIIIWGWGAKTESQINDFLQNNLTTITLDGKAIDGKMDEGIINKNGTLEVVWRSEVGLLDPGQHTVTYDVKWKTMIDDGTNTYGPGGQIETVQDKCLVIVQ